MDVQVLRATETWQQAGAYYVRIQAMARQHHITLRQEFDAHDGPDSRYIVLLDADFPVATCRLYPLSDEAVMLGRVVVLPEYRGQGLGRRAVLEAEAWARELGYRTAVLESRDVAVGFYEALGYTADRTRVVQNTFTCIHMEKSCRNDSRVSAFFSLTSRAGAATIQTAKGSSPYPDGYDAATSIRPRARFRIERVQDFCRVQRARQKSFFICRQTDTVRKG